MCGHASLQVISIKLPVWMKDEITVKIWLTNTLTLETGNTIMVSSILVFGVPNILGVEDSFKKQENVLG